jgi:hypothetical protein
MMKNNIKESMHFSNTSGCCGREMGVKAGLLSEGENRDRGSVSKKEIRA